MGSAKSEKGHRPRELRRRVVLPARLRTGARWSDSCILNISSRGLMIQSAHATAKGSVVELHRGDHVIVARVVWRDGARAGLRSEERLPVEEILSLGQSHALRLTAGDRAFVERRKRPRPASDARDRGRLVEFAGVIAITASLATGAWAMAEQALASPMAQVAAALGGQSEATLSK
jgi:hypothetical protein